jgi:hypothetical protein
MYNGSRYEIIVIDKESLDLCLCSEMLMSSIRRLPCIRGVLSSACSREKAYSYRFILESVLICSFNSVVYRICILLNDMTDRVMIA